MFVSVSDIDLKDGGSAAKMCEILPQGLKFYGRFSLKNERL